MCAGRCSAPRLLLRSHPDPLAVLGLGSHRTRRRRRLLLFADRRSGSSVALIGAYTLAGELKLARYDGRVDYRQGCHAYETRVRRYVLAFQALAFDSVTNNSMITPDRFNGIVNSITLEDYS